MKKIYITRIILILMLLGTFYLIFSFSAEDGDTSKTTSERISEFVLNTFTDYKNMPDGVEKKEILKSVTKIVRKAAHYTIYIVVGMLLMGICYTYKMGDGRRFMISQISGIIYATSDEIHQLFVDGRSGEFRDVLLDSLGVLTGILMVVLIIKIYKEIKLKKNKKEELRAK